MNELELFAIKYSLIVALISVIINIPLSILAVYFLRKCSSFFKIIFETLFSLPLILPPIVTGYILLFIFSKNFILGKFLYNIFGISIPFTFYASVLASSIVSFPIVLRLIKLTFDSIDPIYIKISRGLGKSRIQAFFLVTIPLATKGIISASLLGFARAIGEFGANIMLAGNIPYKTTTIPVAIFSFFNQTDGDTSVIRLVLISVFISLTAMMISEILNKANKL